MKQKYNNNINNYKGVSFHQYIVSSVYRLTHVKIQSNLVNWFNQFTKENQIKRMIRLRAGHL